MGLSEDPKILIEMLFFNSYIPYLESRVEQRTVMTEPDYTRSFVNFLLADLINKPEDYDVEQIMYHENKNELISHAITFINSTTAIEVIKVVLSKNNFLSKYETESKINETTAKLQANAENSKKASKNRINDINNEMPNLNDAEKSNIKKLLDVEEKILQILNSYTSQYVDHITPPVMDLPTSTPLSPKLKRAATSLEHKTKRKKL